MSWLPVPDIMERDIYALPPRLFLDRGVRFVLLDIDNTLAPYTQDEAGPRLRSWVRDLKAAGLELYILSNNRGERPARFAAALELPYVKHARKPFTAAARRVLAERGRSPEESALVGDQIYTDTLCAKRCGLLAVTVKPIEFSTIWLRLRYWAEFPFRLTYFIKTHARRGAG